MPRSAREALGQKNIPRSCRSADWRRLKTLGYWDIVKMTPGCYLFKEKK
ncbi:hypothetical protein DAMNIGENAA_38760 [Desulforhabdus amnigena]|uniref:Uncharacterized protein n=1 Tax=Desulforhabdus amnigena TaxID=40218 RepID=A0A9W6FX58_9BACT|nr:hypothetical protein DAMNIGENAA_38760 [Desulforhabdus amnigena]